MVGSLMMARATAGHGHSWSDSTVTLSRSSGLASPSLQHSVSSTTHRPSLNPTVGSYSAVFQYLKREEPFH
jgi:hypothetical protein